MWESLVVNLGPRPNSLFGEEFLSASIHSPLSGRLIGPSGACQQQKLFEQYLGGAHTRTHRNSQVMCFSGEIYACAVRGFEFVISSLARSFLTILPT
jgi:hypothetical protein